MWPARGAALEIEQIRAAVGLHFERALVALDVHRARSDARVPGTVGHSAASTRPRSRVGGAEGTWSHHFVVAAPRCGLCAVCDIWWPISWCVIWAPYPLHHYGCNNVGGLQRRRGHRSPRPCGCLIVRRRHCCSAASVSCQIVQVWMAARAPGARLHF